MRYILFILLSCAVQFSYGQKKMLQLDSYQSWPQAERARISGNGQFVWYKVDNMPVGGSTYFVHSVLTGKEIQFQAVGNPEFSDKSNFLFAQGAKDSMIIIDLDLFLLTTSAHVHSFQLFTKGKNESIAILDTGSLLTFGSTKGQKFFSCKQVRDYKISPDGLSAIVQQNIVPNDPLKINLLWVDFKTGKSNLIYTDQPVSNLLFDNSGNQVAFIVNHDNKNAIWYCKKGALKAVKLIDQNSTGITDSMSIQPGQFWAFNWDGQHLYFSQSPAIIPSKVTNPNLTIWSYKDAFLQTDISNPSNREYQLPEYLSSVDIKNGSINRLVQKGQIISGSFSPTKDYYLLTETFNGRMDDAEWNLSARISYCVCNLLTGKIYVLKRDSKFGISYLHVSPTSKYVAFYDKEFGQYFSYDLTTEKKVAIFTDSTAVLMGIDTRRLGGICGWLPEDKGVVVNDSYDLIRVDPKGLEQPVNLTKGVGRNNKIVFYPVNGYEENTVGEHEEILLSVYDLNTKKWGLYNWKLTTKPDLNKTNLTSNYIENLEQLYHPLLSRKTDNLDAFQKAKQAATYLLRLEKYNEPPNYYVTSDYKTYKAVSSIHPEKQYNFLTAELSQYKDSLGNDYQGILYKPENFDSTHIYPVVLNYYEISSNLLNHFIYAGRGTGDVDVAYLVSNGYLVFKPDIKSQPGKVGEGALHSVNAAADYLAKFKWINPEKMAIAGHSFGGFETNYIVTHSHRYVAAITAAGVSNMVTSYTDINLWPGWGRQGFIRYNSYKMNKILTDDIKGYTDNSPILFADKVTTPLLLMHNPEDASVDFRQGRSFFIELRSLQKRVWMLSYKGNGHGIGEDNHVDYYGRVKEYLDHYLLDKPIPDWMK